MGSDLVYGEYHFLLGLTTELSKSKLNKTFDNYVVLVYSEHKAKLNKFYAITDHLLRRLRVIENGVNNELNLC